MRTITLSIALTLMAGCASQTKSEPIATRPSLTVFPIQMAGQPREDVAGTVALMLERGGMESVDVDADVFTPEPASFDEQANAFAAFVMERGLGTDYAFYGAVIGSPERGVEEIQGVLVDGSGNVAWSDRQTRADSAMKRSRPQDPMGCSVFLVERLREPLNLFDPHRVDAPEGRWADYWRAESLAPTDAERDEMQGRRARLLEVGPAATVLVYPARVGNSWSVECANRLTDEINRHGLLDASVATDRIEFKVQPSRNEQKVLWTGARSIQRLVRANPPNADYVLLADYLVSDGREARGVHTFLLESDGDWVIVDYQNSHHGDFAKIRPTSPAECCDLSFARLRQYLGS